MKKAIGFVVFGGMVIAVSIITLSGRFRGAAKQTNGYDPNAGLGARYLGGGRWGGTSAAWSERGGAIVFAALGDDTSDLYLLKNDGGIERLTNTVYWEILPAFSPASDRIYFLSDQDDRRGEWYFMSPADRRPRRLAPGLTIKGNGPEAGTGRTLRFTADGRNLAFSAAEKDSDCSIFTCSPDGTNLRRLSPEGWYAHSPILSADNRRVFFSVRVHGQPGVQSERPSMQESLWSADLDSAALARVLAPQGDFLLPLAQEDNGCILLVKEGVPSNPELWALEPGGSEPKRLTRGGHAGVYNPVYNRTDRSVLFCSDLGESYEYDVCRFDLRSNTTDRLTDNRSYVTLFTVSADGNKALLLVDDGRKSGRGWIGELDVRTKELRRLVNNHSVTEKQP